MKEKLFLLSFVLLTGLGQLFSQIYSDEDKSALLAIDDKCDSGDNLNWNTEADPANWDGISWNSDNPKRVEKIEVWNKSLTDTLDVSALTELVFLACHSNQLSFLNLAGLTKLDIIGCEDNQLTGINLTGTTVGDLLACGYNQLTTIDVSDLKDLQRFYCQENEITRLDITQNAKLVELYCPSNQLTGLDFPEESDLSSISCRENQITSLDLSNLANLKYLICNKNQLSGLDVSNLTNLEQLVCYENQISSLDVSALTKLISIDCGQNLLTSLDISALLNLESLYIADNQFTSMDVSPNTKLLFLNCRNNRLPFSSLATGLFVVDYFYSPQHIIFQEQTVTGDITIDYSAEAMIADMSTTFIWNKYGEAVNSNTSGMFSTFGDGAYNCYMTNGLFPGLTLITATITVGGPSRIDKTEDSFTTMYPNPAKDRVFITKPEGIEQVSVYSLTGTELIKTTDISAGIDLSGLSAGTYLVTIVRNEHQAVQKIVIK
jgi:Leucine-rich repeat (LRR) protein